ncbi:MAG: cation:proton antiporter [Neisseriaceae bacterium]|nr:cation:proton antiporter [Neisseriaceae bacterium]MBP6862263.1 cation:proton antiporter [Neisseriaceae bacterium]
MPHATPLIATIVGGLVFAFIFGTIAQRFKMPPLVGYLVAGIVVGPFTPGFVANGSLAQELAELGVILLMFGVGLHFSLKDLLAVKNIAIPGAVVQISVATILGMGLAWLIGWDMGAGLIFGLALSTASTVVLLTALQERRILETKRGRIAVGWLIVEDIAMVLTLVLIPALGGVLSGDGGSTSGADIAMVFLITIGKVVAFVAVMLVLGRRIIPYVLEKTADTGSKELFRLAVLAIALGCAMGATYVFGVSFALGAFFAGMILSESELSHRAAEESLPLRDAFSVLFFVSVGMLLDPAILVQEPLLLLATVLIIVVGKSIAAYGIVRLFGYPTLTALTISASLAQIGEFAFIVASMGMVMGLLPKLGSNLVVGGAIFSILLNPVWFMLLERYKHKFAPKVAEEPAAEPVATPATPEVVAPELVKVVAAVEDGVEEISLVVDEYGEVIEIPVMENHVVLVGYGRVGRLVVDELQAQQRPFVVQESRLEVVEELKAQEIPVAFGHALADEMMDIVNVAQAQTIIITMREPIEAGQIITRAKEVNPDIQIIVRADTEGEFEYLSRYGASDIIYSPEELAERMIKVLMPQRVPEPEPEPSLKPDDEAPLAAS